MVCDVGGTVLKLSRYNCARANQFRELGFSSLVHNEDSQPLGMTTSCAKDRGLGGEWAGGRLPI